MFVVLPETHWNILYNNSALFKISIEAIQNGGD